MMQLIQRAAAAVLLPVLMAGCVSAPVPAGPVKTMKLVMDDAQAAPANQWDVQVQLGAIPGRLMGSPLVAPRLLIPAAFDKEFSVPLAEVERVLGREAAPAGPKLIKGGLQMAPLETRYLRVSTFVFDKKAGEIVLGGGFLDQDGQFVMLAYFDRPCTVQGVEGDDDYRMAFDLVIPGAGMYWLRSERTTAKTARITLARPDTLLRFEAPRPAR